MIEKQTLSHQAIIDCLKTNYGISAILLILLPIGADMNASVYKAETKSGQSYFVKLKRGHRYDMSVAILALLQASGIKQIIPPIKTTNGELTQHINDFTLTVYPFVNGQNGFCYNLTGDQWITLGKVLREVHEFDVPPSVKDLIRKETYSNKWREAVQALDAHIDEYLHSDDTALKLLSFMKEHRTIINHLVDRAEILSQKIQKQLPEFVLCHSDIHGGNVLIDENGSIFIVDWDDPIMAPKERDLMFIGGGVANVWNNPLEEEFFYKGYGKTEINQTILAYYRHERIVEDIAEYGQALLLTTDGEDREEMFEHFKGMFEPNGVIDIALKTDLALQACPISSEKDKDAALDFKQKHFFDRLKIQDPYTWALISFYKERLNLQEAHFTFIDHEDAMVAVVFKISQSAGPNLILKVCSRKGDFLKESYFLNRFAGKIPVPKIIQLIEPEAGLDAAVLMECVPGDLLKSETVTRALAWEIGSLLARIHLEHAEGYGDLTDPLHLSNDPRIPFTMKFEEGLEECKGHLPKSLLETCRRLFDKDIDLLLSADGPCVIHRDFRPGNLIASEGKVRGIIDWSSGRGGFAEDDFCPLEFGEWPACCKGSFLEGYASVRKVPDYKLLMPLLRLSRAVAAVGFTIKRGTWESRNSKLYQFNLSHLESLVARENA